MSFVIMDSKPHLNENGIRYLCEWLRQVYIIMTNENYFANNILGDFENLEIISYDKEIDFNDLFEQLRSQYHIERLTIQSGGMMNSHLLREGLIDYVKVVVAPLLVGGKDTPIVIDGESIESLEELSRMRALRLNDCIILNDSYVLLDYDVINQTIVE